MKKKKKTTMKIEKLVILVGLALLLAPFAFAISIGISPSRIFFDPMVRGGYAEYPVTLSTDSPDTMMAHFKIEGDIASWVRLEPGPSKFNISATSQFRPRIIVEVPNDAMNGNYSALVTFETEEILTPGGRAGSNVRVGVVLILQIEVTGIERKSCRAGAFLIDDVELGEDLNIRYTLVNTGNVRLGPTLLASIWDQEQQSVLATKEMRGEEVLPTTTKQLTSMMANKLPPGQYWINLGVGECKVEELLTFNVYERGSLIDKGELEKLTNKGWAAVNETVPIAAVFKNTGSRTVAAKFKGNVLLNGRVEKAIVSDEIDIPSGMTSELMTYFNPDKPGKYTITGRVVYNKKLSYEKGNVLNVYSTQPEKQEPVSLVPFMLYLIIIITIIFLIRRIVLVEGSKKRFGRKKNL